MEIELEYADAYLNWLIEKVEAHDYRMLMRLMQRIDFYSPIPLDENRAADGKKLRIDFAREFPEYSDDILNDDHDASVLEVIISLAERMDFELCETFEDVDKAPVYFWDMIENLGLHVFTDDEARNRGTVFRREVRNTLYDLCERNYRPNGSGGLFPIRNPGCDQREIELWNQMNAYIQENY